MKIRLLKKITVEGREYKPGIYNMWSDYAKQAIDAGNAIDLEGKYVRKQFKQPAVIEKRVKTNKKDK